jgi:hypothetical protein
MNSKNVALARMIGASLALYELALTACRPEGLNVGKLISGALQRPVLLGTLGALFVGECSAALLQRDPALLDRIHGELFAASEQFPADGVLPEFASQELTSLSLVAYHQTRGRFVLGSELRKC